MRDVGKPITKRNASLLINSSRFSNTLANAIFVSRLLHHYHHGIKIFVIIFLSTCEKKSSGDGDAHVLIKLPIAYQTKNE